MSKNTSSSTAMSETGIPPPPDPFPTYQTPYPRSSPSSSDDPNPFILFKQFADEKVSSLLSNLCSIFEPASHIDSASSRAPQGTQDSYLPREVLKALEASRLEFEAIKKKMEDDRARHEEGFRKRFEQEWEEKRINNEQRMSTAQERMNQWRAGYWPSTRPAANPDTELDMYEQDFRQQDPFEPLFGFMHELNRRPTQQMGYGHLPLGEAGPFDPKKSEQQAFLWWTNSPYSPLRLSDQENTSLQPSKMASLLDWDAAFHDLLSHDRPDVEASDDVKRYDNDLWTKNLLNSYETAKKFKGTSGPRYSSSTNRQVALREWVHELDAALLKQWPHIWNTRTSESKPLESVPENVSNPPAFSEKSSQLNSGKMSSNDIMYNITSTDTKRLPDGTVETRRVTTTGYRDGSKNKNETVTTRPPISTTKVTKVMKHSTQPENESTLPNQPVAVAEPGIRRKANDLGKGWFWN